MKKQRRWLRCKLFLYLMTVSFTMVFMGCDFFADGEIYKVSWICNRDGYTPREGYGDLVELGICDGKYEAYGNVNGREARRTTLNLSHSVSRGKDEVSSVKNVSDNGELVLTYDIKTNGGVINTWNVAIGGVDYKWTEVSDSDVEVENARYEYIKNVSQKYNESKYLVTSRNSHLSKINGESFYLTSHYDMGDSLDDCDGSPFFDSYNSDSNWAVWEKDAWTETVSIDTTYNPTTGKVEAKYKVSRLGLCSDHEGKNRYYVYQGRSDGSSVMDDIYSELMAYGERADSYTRWLRHWHKIKDINDDTGWKTVVYNTWDEYLSLFPGVVRSALSSQARDELSSELEFNFKKMCEEELERNCLNLKDGNGGSGMYLPRKIEMKIKND